MSKLENPNNDDRRYAASRHQQQTAASPLPGTVLDPPQLPTCSLHFLLVTIVIRVSAPASAPHLFSAVSVSTLCSHFSRGSSSSSSGQRVMLRDGARV